jgi:hypothetical protein
MPDHHHSRHGEGEVAPSRRPRRNGEHGWPLAQGTWGLQIWPTASRCRSHRRAAPP